MIKSVNRSQLAELCGVNLSTVDNWVRDGCPFVSRPVRQGGRGWEFLTSAVIEWLRNRERQSALSDVVKIDEAEARRRKLSAEAQLAELELHKASGAVVSIEDSQRAWSQFGGAIRAKVLALPKKLCRLVAVETDVAVCEVVIEQGCFETLNELAKFEADPNWAKMPEVLDIVAEIRNAAVTGGLKQFGEIITACDRIRSIAFTVSVDARSSSEPLPQHKPDRGGDEAAATVNDQPVGRSRSKAKSRSK